MDSATQAGAAAWRAALLWLRARDRSAAQIRQRLAQAGYDEELIAATVARLRQRGFLDDGRFADSLTQRLAARGHGSQRARRDLEAAGIAGDQIEPAIAAVFADEIELARQALTARHGVPASDRERARAARFLLGRGFPEAIAEQLIAPGSNDDFD